MNARTEFQAVIGRNAKPPMVEVPHDPFLRMRGGFTPGTVPDEVVWAAFDRGLSPMAAWREHLGFTQAEVATRIGVAQAACSEMERVKHPRKATLEKVSAALGLEAEQLQW